MAEDDAPLNRSADLRAGADPKAGAPRGEDASVRFFMTKDGMKVGISRYTPATGGGKPLSVETIARLLLKSGINAEMDRDAAAKAVEMLKKGEDVRKVVIARGKKPNSGKDADVTLNGDFNFPVYPGTVIGRLTPAVLPCAGHTVDGRPVTVDCENNPREIAVGKNIVFNNTDRSIISQVYGLVRYTGEEILVEPLMSVDNEGLQVIGTVFHTDYFGNTLNIHEVSKDLKRLQVVLPIRKKTFASALKMSAREQRAITAVLVKGKVPVDGRDGRLEIEVQDRADIGEEKRGRIDFRNRGTFPTVEPGMKIATLHEPTKGLPGTDVYGRPIPPRGGMEFPVKAGENVEFDEKENVFKSTGSGMMVYQNGTLMVTEFLEIRGDVNYASGNIVVERGSVKVQGSVLSGFSVNSPGSVVVGEVIEDADVKAGKDICVMGGILMKEGGLIRAGGDITAQFANNAVIRSGGNVDIANNTSNCTVQAAGAVYADKGKGIIMGGSITAGTLVIANEIGSDIGVRTLINIRIKSARNIDIIKERRALKEQIRKVDNSLGTEPDDVILNRIPADKKDAITKILLNRAEAKDRLKEISEIMEQERLERMRILEKARVMVKGRVHPGTIIKIGGRVMEITSPTSNSKFFYDPTSRSLAVSSLK